MGHRIASTALAVATLAALATPVQARNPVHHTVVQLQVFNYALELFGNGATSIVVERRSDPGSAERASGGPSLVLELAGTRIQLSKPVITERRVIRPGVERIRFTFDAIRVLNGAKRGHSPRLATRR